MSITQENGGRDFIYDQFLAIHDTVTEMNFTSERQKRDFLILEIARHFGGQLIYFPSGSGSRSSDILEARDRLIREEFNGVNQRQLAIKYNLSTVQIYKILKGKPTNE